MSIDDAAVRRKYSDAALGDEIDNFLSILPRCLLAALAFNSSISLLFEKDV